jgi:hypothetical protein
MQNLRWRKNNPTNSNFRHHFFQEKLKIKLIFYQYWKTIAIRTILRKIIGKKFCRFRIMLLQNRIFLKKHMHIVTRKKKSHTEYYTFHDQLWVIFGKIFSQFGDYHYHNLCFWSFIIIFHSQHILYFCAPKKSNKTHNRRCWTLDILVMVGSSVTQEAHCMFLLPQNLTLKG